MLHYEHVPQLPFCCVPACVAMILRRRHLRELSQQDLGRHLGLTIPPKLKEKFPGAIVSRHKNGGYGCSLYPPHSLTDLFKKEKYPLREEYLSGRQFISPDDFADLVWHHGTKQNDMLASYDASIIYGKDRHVSHVSLLSAVHQNNLRIVDPAKKQPTFVDIPLFLSAINRNNGGVWVISSL